MDVSDIFNFFLLRGGGRGSPAKGGGGADFLLNPRRGVSRRERGRGGGRVSGRIGEFGGGGGLNIFFRGRNVHQVLVSLRKNGI